MQVKVKEIIEALAKLKPGLGKEGIIEHMTHFVFDKDIVFTYNDRIAVSFPLKSGIQGGVIGDQLYSLLNKIDQPEIQMKASSKELRISYRKKKESLKAGLNLTPKKNINWSEFPRVKSNKWLPLPKNFKDALRFCIFSCATDATLGFLTHVKVAHDQVMSCDNFRATKYFLSKNMSKPFLIPGDSAGELLKYEIEKYIATDDWAHFKAKDGVIFSTRAMSYEKYKDIDDFFEVKGKAFTLPAKFRKVVERSNIIASDAFDEDRPIELSVGNGEIVCSGEGEGGWITEKHKVEYSGKAFTIQAKPNHLIQILDHSRRVVASDSMVLFQAKSFSHVMCQIVGKE